MEQSRDGHAVHTTNGGPIYFEGDAKIHSNKVVTGASRDARQYTPADTGASPGEFGSPQKNLQQFRFQPGMRVADFGAGSGAYTIPLAYIVGVEGAVYAVDVQRDLLTRIQNTAMQHGIEHIETVWSDLDTPGGVGIRDELLDGVVFSNTLFQVENKNVSIKEAWRVLKPGGTLGIIEWKDSFNGLGPPPEDVVTQAETSLVCTDNGFTVRREFEAGEYHYGIVCAKPNAQKHTDGARASGEASAENDFVTRTIQQEII